MLCANQLSTGSVIFFFDILVCQAAWTVFQEPVKLGENHLGLCKLFKKCPPWKEEAHTLMPLSLVSCFCLGLIPQISLTCGYHRSYSCSCVFQQLQRFKWDNTIYFQFLQLHWAKYCFVVSSKK